MSPVLVTGATGFMGRVLVARLLEEGRAVRVLERRPGDAFEGQAVERVTGDVTQPGTLAAACAGAEAVFNLAGVLSYDAKDEASLQAVNVDGLANVLAAAREAGSGRVVHVSSVAAVGFTEDPPRPLSEDSPFPQGAWHNRYARTKRLGEEIAFRAAAEGQDVVVACPGFLLGPGDVNRINTFVVEEYLRGLLRTTVAGGISSVDVRDVADGLLAVESRGVSGSATSSRARTAISPTASSSRWRARSTASPGARSSCRLRCSAAARASGTRCGCRSAQPRGDRGRMPLLVRHAGPGDERARLPSAPCAGGHGGDRPLPARRGDSGRASSYQR